MRIVASMTTIPQRISRIAPVVEAVLGQIRKIERLQLNIPFICVRTGEPYAIPPWLLSMDRVEIIRTDDYGSITKIAPTLVRHKEDAETYIWSVDDDCAYPANQLEILCRVHDPGKRRILTRYGGKLHADGHIDWWYGEAEVNIFEGFGGVLYPPACIGDDFEKYVQETSKDKDCRMSDDIVLSLYFSAHKLPIYLYNQPSEQVPYMVTGWLPHSNENALGQGGHLERYRRVYRFINDQQLLP